MAGVEVPRLPVVRAVVREDGSGELTMASSTHRFDANDVEQARALVLARVAAYANDQLRRPVRVEVLDPQGGWLLGVHPSGAVEDLGRGLGEPGETNGAESPEPDGGSEVAPAPPRPEMRVLSSPTPSPQAEPHAATNGRGATAEWPEQAAADVSPTPSAAVGRRSPAPAPAPPSPRRALHEPRPSVWTRGRRWVNHNLKSPDEHAEDELDRYRERRVVVSEPNVIAVVSPKGGPGKTTVAAVLGDALARFLPNHRVLANDLNPGGGALAAIAPDDRAATRTMLDLFEHREEIRSHAHLQPYVSSLRSGLEILGVPPEPRLAQQITPGHYHELLDRCLLPNYNVIVLDTKPDIIADITQVALDRAHQLVIVTEQDFLTGDVVEHGLPFLLSSPAAGPDASRAVMVLNQVLDDPRAGRIEEARRHLTSVFDGPVIEVPWDLDLRAQLNVGDYTLDGIRRRDTRLPLKRLAVHVLERLV